MTWTVWVVWAGFSCIDTVVPILSDCCDTRVCNFIDTEVASRNYHWWNWARSPSSPAHLFGWFLVLLYQILFLCSHPMELQHKRTLNAHTMCQRWKMFEARRIIKKNLFPLKLNNKSQSGYKLSSPVFFATTRNELLPLPTNYWHLMPAINGTFGGFFHRSPTFTVRLFAGEKGPRGPNSLTHPSPICWGDLGARRGSRGFQFVAKFRFFRSLHGC